MTRAGVPELVAPLHDFNGKGTLWWRIRELAPKCRNSLRLRRIFEPPFSDLVPLPLMLAFGDVNSSEWPRRERSGADTVVVAVDFEDAEVGKMEAGSGIKSTFPRAIVSTTWASLESEGRDCSRWCDSDSGGTNSVDAADDTEVDGKELEERRDMCSGVDADVDGATAA
jgi:hypothetical protein